MAHCKSKKNDRDFTIMHVNNCYINCIIMRITDFREKRKVFFSAYSWYPGLRNNGILCAIDQDRKVRQAGKVC